MLSLEGGLYSARVGLNHGQFTLLDDEAKPMRLHSQRNLSVCQQCSCAVSAKPGRQIFFRKCKSHGKCPRSSNKIWLRLVGWQPAPQEICTPLYQAPAWTLYSTIRACVRHNRDTFYRFNEFIKATETALLNSTC